MTIIFTHNTTTIYASLAFTGSRATNYIARLTLKLYRITNIKQVFTIIIITLLNKNNLFRNQIIKIYIKSLNINYLHLDPILLIHQKGNGKYLQPSFEAKIYEDVAREFPPSDLEAFDNSI